MPLLKHYIWSGVANSTLLYWYSDLANERPCNSILKTGKIDPNFNKEKITKADKTLKTKLRQWFKGFLGFDIMKDRQLWQRKWNSDSPYDVLIWTSFLCLTLLIATIVTYLVCNNQPFWLSPILIRLLLSTWGLNIISLCLN